MHHWVGNTSAFLLFTIVALAPLPFGSSESIIIVGWCALLGCTLIFAPVNRLGVNHIVFASLGVFVLLSYGLVLHEQLSSHPWSSAAVPNQNWNNAELLLQEKLDPVVTIIRNQPYFALGPPLIAFLALANGFAFGVNGKYARLLLSVIAWSGACYAIYGIAQTAFDPSKILWTEKHAYQSVLTSTFINRNTAAVFFGSCCIVWLSLASRRIRLWRTLHRLPWWTVLDRILVTAPRDVIVPILMATICLTAMFMTGSRAGAILSLMALLFAGHLLFGRTLSGKWGIATSVGMSAGLALLALQFMGENIVRRFDFQNIADEGRLSVYRSTLRMIADHPWLGTGQGTFASAFPAYRSNETSMYGVWDIAHNTLLEIASDMGIPIAALVALSWTAIILALSRGLSGNEHTLCVRVSALSVALLAVAHSMVDFSLQIPGYSIVSLTLVGAGLAQSCNRPLSRQPSVIRSSND